MSKYIIAAIHRQETLYDKKKILICLYAIEKASKIATVKFIQHPLTKNKLTQYKISLQGNIEYLDLLIYPEFIKLVAGSIFVISDGGGLQEETYYLNKPLLIMRKKTERMIGLNSTAYLAEFDKNRIDYFLSHWKDFKRKNKIASYNPSKIIADELSKRAL